MLSVSPRVAGGLCALGISAAAAAGPSVEAVWLRQAIDIDTCSGLTRFGSGDLYLAFDVDPGGTIAVTSDETTGLEIINGTFHQDETGANGPRPEGWFKVFPCARWDSYLTIGGTTPFFSPEYPPLDEEDWGTRIVAEWLPEPGEAITVEVDMQKFGDLRHYVHIARLTTTPETTTVVGTLEVVYFPFPSMPTVPVQETVQVENCPACWLAVDLDGDGTIGPGDLAALLAFWGSCSGCAADFNCDGVIDSEDLAALLALWEG